MSVFKWIMGVGAFIALVVVLLVAYVLVVFDPNEHKARLVELAKDEGISLDIEGDLAWQLWPDLALSVGATHVLSERVEIPEAHLRKASLELSWMPLLKGQVSIKAIHLEGADIRLTSAEQGAAVAAAPLAGADSDAEPSADAGPDAGPGTGTTAPDTNTAFSFAIETLRITDSQLQLPEGQQINGIDLLIEQLNVDGKPFAIESRFNYVDKSLPEVLAVELNTQAAFQLSDQTLALQSTEVLLQIAEKPSVKLIVDSLKRNEQGDIEVLGLALRSAGAALQGAFSLQTGTADKAAGTGEEAFAFKGEFTVPSFALKNTLVSWRVELPEFSDAQALQSAGLILKVEADNTSATVSDFTLSLDGQKITGHAAGSFGKKRALRLDLHSASLDLNPYRAKTSDEGVDKESSTNDSSSSTNSAPTSNNADRVFAPLIAPLAWVGGGKAVINLGIDHLNIDGVSAEKLRLKLRAANRQINISDLSGHVFDGDIAATAKVDLRRKAAKVTFTADLKGVDVGKASAAFNEEDAMLLGQLSATLKGNTSGNTVEHLHRGLQANGQVDLVNPVIPRFNVERAYCDIAALVEKTPQRTDWAVGSRLRDFKATLRFKGQQVHIDNYATGLGNLSFGGTGLVDLGKARFDVLADTRLNGDQTSEQGCLIKSRRIRDKTVSVRC